MTDLCDGLTDGGPRRIQLKRTKGWRMPEGAVKVDRSTKFGNPWTIDGARKAGFSGANDKLRNMCIGMFRNAIYRRLPAVESHLSSISELRGKDLACWCPLDQPCHADVLLELANADPTDGAP